MLSSVNQTRRTAPKYLSSKQAIKKNDGKNVKQEENMMRTAKLPTKKSFLFSFFRCSFDNEIECQQNTNEIKKKEKSL